MSEEKQPELTQNQADLQRVAHFVNEAQKELKIDLEVSVETVNAAQRLFAKAEAHTQLRKEHDALKARHEALLQSESKKSTEAAAKPQVKKAAAKK